MGQENSILNAQPKATMISKCQDHMTHMLTRIRVSSAGIFLVFGSCFAEVVLGFPQGAMSCLCCYWEKEEPLGGGSQWEKLRSLGTHPQRSLEPCFFQPLHASWLQEGYDFASLYYPFHDSLSHLRPKTRSQVTMD